MLHGRRLLPVRWTLFAWIVFFWSTPALPQEMPAEYQEVLKFLGKQGDFKANVDRKSVV